MMARIALISQSPLTHDSRLLRHALALKQAGHQPQLFGLGPPPSDACGVPVTICGGTRSDGRIRTGIVLRNAPATVFPASAAALYWASAVRLEMRRKLFEYHPQIVIANDWQTLPLAVAMRNAFGSRIIYDSHEFATSEFMASRAWRWLARRHVQEVEARNIVEADVVMTVSHGLSQRLQALYDLSPAPSVVRNRPHAASPVVRATGAEVTVLYQGIIAPRRGLETLIDSVRTWKEHLRLVIRGPAAGDHLATLQARPAASDPRIFFEPPVSPLDTVASASSADIGIFLAPEGGGQDDVMLPNKIFEYMAAGLAVVTSDLPQIRRVDGIEAAALFLPEASEGAIAESLNGLTTERIDRLRQAALAAYRKDADLDAKRFIDLVAQVLL
jgi:glycosyltransferase involved in cell wall biosynthesis